ncbi:MAG: hypothetical protein WC137_02515 [Alphaproteobacteria bacterium]
MKERERNLSPEMLARLAKMQAAINAEADKFKNPETFMSSLESTLSRTAQDSGGVASLDYEPQSKMYKLWFANQRQSSAIDEIKKSDARITSLENRTTILESGIGQLQLNIDGIKEDLSLIKSAVIK